MKDKNTGMKIDSGHSRRQFLKLTGYGTLGLMAGGLWPGRNRLAAGQAPDTEFVPDLDISLSARPGEVAVFPGNLTRVWRYHATVHTGDRARIVEMPRSYLGPIIKVHQGEKIRIRFRNTIPEASIVHWHGLHVPAIMDGHPRYVVSQGQSYLYEFEVKNRAGTYWYHPHPHGRTGPQVYRGLAGLFLVRSGDAVNYYRPRQFYLTMRHMQWTINGRVFQMEEVADDEIVRLDTAEIWEFDNTGGGMMDMMNMPHPIHLHGKQFRVIERGGVAHDGYVDEGWKDTVLLMPGERIRILVDFDDYPGMFLYHCHNLEHEDMGIMRNYFVR